MKKIVNNHAKEVIKARILHQATKLWGVHNPNALDPLVSLLIDAFSTEIFKVNNDIENIKVNILEKIARVLTPSIYTYPRPAHAIAITHPEESREVLLNHQEFYSKKIFTSNVKAVADLKLDIPFTAVDHVQLVKSKVCYCLIGNRIWEYDVFYNSRAIVKLDRAIANNQLFLALDLSGYELEYIPDRFSLYCDNPTYESLGFVYQLLPFIKASAEGKPLVVTGGLSYSNYVNKSGYEATIEDYSIENRIQENIKAIYAGKFIELSGFKRKMEDLALGVVPEAIAFLNRNEEAQNLIKDKKLLWIQIDFPAQYSQEIMEGFSFYLNAFPVYNRGWRQNESSLDIMGNTIPLVTQVGEAFLYTEQIVDSHARIYNEILFSENNSLRQGLYTVRKGGMERFSERNAIDLITQVIELTRDEVSAFGILDRDKVIDALKKMVDQMQSLDQKVKAVNGRVANEVHYVIVEPMAQTEYVKATYWVTHCTLANSIRKGIQLSQQDKVYTNVNRHITLLSTTLGGEREKMGTDAIQAYKYALTTRDKIISNEDVKNYCKMVLQANCKHITISKGIQVSDKPKEGFVRTVNIEIVVDNYEEMGTQYWVDYSRSLKQEIESRSIDGITYLVHFRGDHLNEEEA